MADELVSVDEAASVLGVDRRTVRYYIADGKLPAILVGGVWIIKRKDLTKVDVKKVGRPRKIKRGSGGANK